MTPLHIPAQEGLDTLPMDAASEQLLSGACIQVACVNWPKDFPYCPQTTIHLLHTSSTLYLRYDVTGQQLRAMVATDQGEVWCDSCVEFFCQIPGDDYYMNFETSCIGKMVASRRKGKNEDVRLRPTEEMQRIRRYASCGNTPFAERDGEFSWTLCIAIPIDLLAGKNYSFPLALKGNFYKCADETKHPHFVSWLPIELSQPNFHCPQFFGEIVLD